MALSIRRRISAVFCFAFLVSLFLPVPAMADPYPSNSKAVPVDATTVLITWEPNAWAEGYLIHRNNAGTIATLPADEHQYLDTGLTPGLPYFYLVGSLVDGNQYWDVNGDTYVMPVDPVVDLTAVSWHLVPHSEYGQLLEIHLDWTPVANINDYRVFARIGSTGDYLNATWVYVSEAWVPLPVPHQDTRYWFKVCAIDSYYSPESQETIYFDGPSSPEAFIDVPAEGAQVWKTLSPLFTIKPEIPHLITPTPSPFKPLKTILPVRTIRPILTPLLTPTSTLSPVTRTIRPELPASAPPLVIRTSLPVLPIATPAPILQQKIPRLLVPRP